MPAELGFRQGQVIAAAVMDAGATRGLLLLAQGNELVIQGESSASGRADTSHGLLFAGSGKGPERLVKAAIEPDLRLAGAKPRFRWLRST